MSADDPVADFLAREQDDLAGLEDNLASTEIQDDDFTGAVETEPEEITEEQAQMNAENDCESEMAGTERNVSVAAALGGAVEDAASLAVSAPPASMYETAQSRPSEEPEKILKWRDEQRQRLQKKDAEEQKKIAEWRALAKKELDDWYKSRAEQLQNASKNNRAAEEQLVAERDAVTPGKDWERVARLCEFNPKTTKATKDVSRMRSLLLQLKQADGGAAAADSQA